MGRCRWLPIWDLNTNPGIGPKWVFDVRGLLSQQEIPLKERCLDRLRIGIDYRYANTHRGFLLDNLRLWAVPAKRQAE